MTVTKTLCGKSLKEAVVFQLGCQACKCCPATWIPVGTDTGNTCYYFQAMLLFLKLKNKMAALNKHCMQDHTFTHRLSAGITTEDYTMIPTATGSSL